VGGLPIDNIEAVHKEISYRQEFPDSPGRFTFLVAGGQSVQTSQPSVSAEPIHAGRSDGDELSQTRCGLNPSTHQLDDHTEMAME
jgi:hypothetical protein